MQRFKSCTQPTTQAFLSIRCSVLAGVAWIDAEVDTGVHFRLMTDSCRGCGKKHNTSATCGGASSNHRLPRDLTGIVLTPRAIVYHCHPNDHRTYSPPDPF